MDDSKADILMMFMTPDGPVMGESKLVAAVGDSYMDGFRPGSYDAFGNFFEVTNFSFSLQVSPQEQNVGTMTKSTVRGAAPTGRGATVAATTMGNDPYDKWRSAKQSELDTLRYPVKFESFSFDRVIDAASPVFFNYCANQKRFTSATMVKRQLSRSKEAGKQAMQSLGFLRIEFKDLLLTSLSWDDGDMVTEKCTMTCGDMQVKYKRQAMDGGLSGTTSTAGWNRERNSKADSTDS